MKPFSLAVTDEIFLVPALHYSIESASEVLKTILSIKPDAVALEIPASCHEAFQAAINRLPYLSAVRRRALDTSIPEETIFIPIEPCDPLVEGARAALDLEIPFYSVDLDIINYPNFADPLVDPYAIVTLGLEKYVEFSLFQPQSSRPIPVTPFDDMRESHMAKEIFHLSLRHGKVVAIVGMHHLFRISSLIRQKKFEAHQDMPQAYSFHTDIVTYNDEKIREVMKTPGYLTRAYETWRESLIQKKDASADVAIIDKLEVYADLLDETFSTLASEKSTDDDTPFRGIHFPLQKQAKALSYLKRLSRVRGLLIGETVELIESVQGMLGQKAAYNFWKKLTHYPFTSNVENIPEVDIEPKDLWGNQTTIRFRPTLPSEKSQLFQKALQREKYTEKSFSSSFSICSYPPEDSIVESFGEVLKKRGVDLLAEEATVTIPFSTSMEDGIDVRETIRNRFSKQDGELGLYVKRIKAPKGKVGSCVVIFHEDSEETLQKDHELFPWVITWHGEHTQESDMALYASHPHQGIIGPGIARCTYGGFLLSYPPGRLMNVWSDRDYTSSLHLRQDILLAAAIDYSQEPLVIYSAPSSPSETLRHYAALRGRKILYIPIKKFSERRINRLKTFHVLDSKERRSIAKDYIFEFLDDLPM